MPQKKKIRDRLIKRFYTKFNPEAYDEAGGNMPDLVANDQHPEVLFISCIDSRVAPGMIFKMNPGEALNHRHIAGLVPPYDPAWEKPGADAPGIAASIDFAVQDKKVGNISIKGHTMCGGIKAYSEGSASPLVKAWMSNAGPALNKIDRTQEAEELLRQAERECIKYSFRNLMTYPSIKQAMTEGRLAIEAWIHDIENGLLLRFDPQKDDFIILQEDGSDITGHIKDTPAHKCSHD